MTEQFAALTDDHIAFIALQPVFFVGTGGAGGRIDVSPKGMDSSRLLDQSRVVWLNLTGSGNETAAHVLENRRMTLMFCSFEKQPLILRLYGNAAMTYPRDEAQFARYSALFDHQPGARQFFELDVDLVQTSGGYAVPRFEPGQERPTFAKWAAREGEYAIRQYWSDKNRTSLDGQPTGIEA